MALRTILTVPDPLLKQASKPVEIVDDRIRALMDDMLETMYDAPGIGLAASQIGVLERVIVVDVAKRKEDIAKREEGTADQASEEESVSPNPICLANPEIVWSSE